MGRGRGSECREWIWRVGVVMGRMRGLAALSDSPLRLVMVVFGRNFSCICS